MAIPFLNNINLDDNQLLNAKLHVTSSAPTAAAGQIYFDSTADPAANPPTYDLTAKYYSNATDQWVSLKEYSFPTGTYVTGAVTGTFPKPIITFDLNAVDGAAAETAVGNGIRYLSKNNKWAEISTIPGTYTFNVTADTGTAQTIGSGGILDIAGGTNINTAVSAASTVTVNLDDSITLAGQLTVNGTGQNLFQGQVTIPPTPVAATDAASKAYVDGLVSGGLTFKGTFRADTGEVISGTNDGNFLYSCPGGAGTRVAVAVGDYYVVATNGGSFYCAGATLDIGDSIIGVTAAAADSSTATNWSIVQSDEGVTDISASLDADLTGINVSATTGSVVVGLSITSLGTGTLPLAEEIEIPYVDTNGPENKKATLEDLVEKANSVTSKTGTITAGSLSGTVTHAFGINTLVQTINSSGDTVFCDVTRTATTSVATIAVAEATDITILVQKIG